MKITERLLRNLKACERGVDLFETVFPDGVIVTDDQEENFEILAPMFDHPSCIGGADVMWLAWALGRVIQGDGGDECFLYPENMAYQGSEFCAAGLLADAVGYYLTNGGKP